MVEKAYISDSLRGRLVGGVFRCYYEFRKVYFITDPLAVAVAMMPGLVKSYMKKWCHVETEGIRSKGLLIVNWPEKFEEGNRPRVKIVTSVDPELIVNALIDSVTDDASKFQIDYNQIRSAFLSDPFCNLSDQYSAHFHSSPLRQHLELYTMDKIIGKLDHEDIIDLGCGTGLYTKFFRNKTKGRIVGIDISPNMIEVAKKESN
jgi:hypothetical protein